MSTIAETIVAATVANLNAGDRVRITTTRMGHTVTLVGNLRGPSASVLQEMDGPLLFLDTTHAPLVRLSDGTPGRDVHTIEVIEPAATMTADEHFDSVLVPLFDDYLGLLGQYNAATKGEKPRLAQMVEDAKAELLNELGGAA